jgi:outer membrane lipase/esterase
LFEFSLRDRSMIASFPRFLRARGLRLATVLSLAASALLSACGSGSTFQPLVPSRFVSFGDGISDLGQTGGNRFTVNDGSTNIWVQQLAARYGLAISASATGGFGFATGGSRVDSGTNPISAQITAFLAANAIGANDVLVIDAGVSELAELATANASDAALATAADLAGKALGAQVKRLTAAGAKHVVIASAPDLGKSPLFAATRSAGLTAATRAFNDGIKLALADVTNNVLLIDNEAYINTLHVTPATLGSGANVTTAACPGVATACTTSNAVSNYNVYLYADDRHFTPNAHRLLGNTAYDKVKARW